MYYSSEPLYKYPHDTSFISYLDSETNYADTTATGSTYIPFIYLGTIDNNNICISNNYIEISGNYYLNTYVKDISWNKFLSLFYSTKSLFYQNYTEISSNLYYDFNNFNMFNHSNGNFTSEYLSLYKEIIISYMETSNISEFSSKFYTKLQKFYSIHQNIFSLLKCNINYTFFNYSQLLEMISQLPYTTTFLIIITITFYPPKNPELYYNIPLNTIPLNTMTLNLAYRITDYV